MEVVNPIITVNEALTSMGSGKFQGLVFAYAGMGWISEAMEMMLLSFIGPAVQSEWNLSPQQESLISSVVFVGMLVAGNLWGIVADKYGRRRGFLLTAIVTFVAGFLSALSPNYTSMLILRGIVGVGLGGCAVFPSWFIEFIPSGDRGSWMVLFSMFWTFGTVLEAILAWLVMPSLGWRWLLALSSLPSLLLLGLYSFTPESPMYLCAEGRTAEAICILEKIARVNQVEMPAGILILDHTTEFDSEPYSPCESSPLLSLRRITSTDSNKFFQKVKSSIKSLSTLSLLFSPELVKPTLLLWIVFFSSSFSSFGLLLLTSELVNPSKHCGLVTNYVSDKSHDASPYRDVLISSFGELPGVLLSAIIVDRLGRKVSMSAMFFLSCMFLLPLIFHQPESITTGLLFGARMGITGANTITVLYVPEVYPTSVRTTGVGVASSVGKIGGLVCPLVAVGLVQGCHQFASIILFEIVIMLSGIAVMFSPFETKGRALN